MNAHTFPHGRLRSRYRTYDECYDLAAPVSVGPLFQASRKEIADAMFAICGPGTTKLPEYGIKRVGSGVIV